MGILDDVTHAGEQPVVTLPEVAPDEIVFFTMTEEEVLGIKDWLNSATDAQKEIVSNTNVTEVSYSHAKLMVKSIFIDVREKLAALLEREFVSLPRVIRYQTLSYSNSEPFTYTKDVVPSSEIIEGENNKQYKIYIVLDGSLKTTNVQDKIFTANEAYCILTDIATEEISNSGEEDSLILCLTLA